MDIAAYLSWARDFLAWLWQKGRLGKTAAVVGTIALLAVSGAWGWSKLSPPAAATKETTAAPTTEIAAGPEAQIKGAVRCCSPEGWPIVETAVHLSGVGPIAANARGQFAHWITAHGSYFECDLPDDGSTYRCLTPQRLDVAQALLLNGRRMPSMTASMTPPPLIVGQKSRPRKWGVAPGSEKHDEEMIYETLSYHCSGGHVAGSLFDDTTVANPPRPSPTSMWHQRPGSTRHRLAQIPEFRAPLDWTDRKAPSVKTRTRNRASSQTWVRGR